ncbi:MAG: TonB-dependent receptor plug domain-containing protein, partial [Leptospiraceae bacterium]|nr:TonB-dependent receptor plug domain-containing protein [Leptospiraceae bacterium]
MNACDALFSQVDSTPPVIPDEIISDYLLAQNDATTETNESDENESDSNDSATQSNEQSIDVVAPQPPSSADTSPAGSASRINTDAYRGRAVGLDEMIERNSGVRVRRYGGLGSYSTISIRGSNANQVNVYLDGIPLNNAQSGEVNLADLNIDGIGQIDVYRSGAPGEFSSAIGGAVNLIPGSGEETPAGTRLEAGGGSFRTYRLSAANWGQSDDEVWKWSASGAYQKSDQDYHFHNDNGTPELNQMDDFDDVRRNAQFRDTGLTGFVSYQPGSTEFKLLNDYKYRLHGVPGPASNQTDKTTREYIRNTTGLATDTPGLFTEEFRLKSRAYYTGAGEEFYDPMQEFSTGSPDSSSRWQSYGAHLMPELYLLDYYQVLRFFLGTERETYRRTERNRNHIELETQPRKFRSHNSVHLVDEISFFDRRLIFLPGIRYERFVDRFNDTDLLLRYTNNPRDILQENKNKSEFTNYEGGLRWVFLRRKPTDVFIKAFAASAGRMPTFFELFGERGSVQGNVDLVPEKSRTYEFGPGFSIQDSRLQAEFQLTGFYKEVRDLILFVPNSQFSLRPDNIDRATISGAEIESRLTLYTLPELRLAGNYTYQRAINTCYVEYLEGNYLPLQPLHE